MGDNKWLRNSFVYVIIMVAVLVLLFAVLQPGKQQQEMSISEVVAAARGGEIDTITAHEDSNEIDIKFRDASKPILDKALSDGTIVGYGSDENLVHRPDGYTHDGWWSSMSMAGLLKVLDQFYTSGNSDTPALQTATKHEDAVLVSRYYNWHSGSYQNADLQVALYKLKDHAPEDAVEMLSKTLVVPLMEKLLADGTIVEYEIDTEAVHTDAPGIFDIVWIAANPEAVDKVNAALKSAMAAQPLGGPAFLSMIDYSKHRDELWRGMGVYK